MRRCCRLLVLLFSVSLMSSGQNDLAALKKEASEKVEARQQFVQQMVDQIFSYAELGFKEFETSKYVTGILEQNGFQVERGVAGVPTAWVATYGSGKPVIAFITDIDCIPRASRKPGVAYHDPIIEGAPGHGEGHNSGMAVNVTAALVLKELMQEHKIAGTLKIFPGVAEGRHHDDRHNFHQEGGGIGMASAFQQGDCRGATEKYRIGRHAEVG